MKHKVFIIILALLVMLCGCNSNSSPQFYPENDMGNDAQSKDTQSKIDVTNKTQTFWEYLSDTKKTTKIMYVTSSDDFGKDSIVTAIYLFKNGKCRKYVDVPLEYCNEYGRWKITVGALSKMTDEEIITMVEQRYQEKNEEAIQFWLDFLSSETAAYPYVSNYEDFTIYLETDNTGNNVVGEAVILPVAGIDDNPHTIYIPSDSEYGITMDVYEPSIDKSNSYLRKEYFGTGYGYKSDFNEITDCYYFNDSSCFSGVVYNSKYLCFNSFDSDWTNGYYTVFFRDENADKLQISFDSLSSPNIDYIDPTEEDINQISKKYFNKYYHSFASKSLISVKEITNFEPVSKPRPDIEKTVTILGVEYDIATTTRLDLSSKQITDAQLKQIAPQIEKLTNLTDLDLWNNQISDITPLASLTNLIELWLNENQISDITPLANLTNLTELGLDGNQISDITPLANLTNLTGLGLGCNQQISDITPLAKLTNLTLLLLGNNQISNEEIERLKTQLPNCEIIF